jgi:hypothetical protein
MNIKPSITKANDALIEEVSEIKFTDEQLVMLSELYSLSIELQEYKDAMVKVILKEFFKLPITDQTEMRIWKVVGNGPNHEMIWLDYHSNNPKLILEFEFLPAGEGPITQPKLLTKSPIEIPKYVSKTCIHEIKHYQ